VKLSRDAFAGFCDLSPLSSEAKPRAEVCHTLGMGCDSSDHLLMSRRSLWRRIKRRLSFCKDVASKAFTSATEVNMAMIGARGDCNCHRQMPEGLRQNVASQRTGECQQFRQKKMIHIHLLTYAKLQ
jgi:hypothetical protein